MPQSSSGNSTADTNGGSGGDEGGGARRRLGLLFLVFGLMAMLAAAAAFSFLGWRIYTQPGPLATDSRIVVERGQTVRSIAQDLDRLGAISDPLAFRIAVRLRGDSRTLRAGEFALPAHVSIAGLLDILRHARPVARHVTIPEGATSARVSEILAAAEGLKGRIERPPPEGELLPDTYQYHWGDSRGDLLLRMMAAQDALMDRLWPQRADDLPFTDSYQALILASIVEKETGVASERRQVASVFVNRLRRGMRLQSDPTVIYGLTGGAPLGRPLRQSELDFETPYNTYRISGLPPTPIANPGAASISAVLDPAGTDYLYFVADGTGGHAFAETLAEHNRNVARWRRLNRQGQ